MAPINRGFLTASILTDHRYRSSSRFGYVGNPTRRHDLERRLEACFGAVVGGPACILAQIASAA